MKFICALPGDAASAPTIKDNDRGNEMEAIAANYQVGGKLDSPIVMQGNSLPGSAEELAVLMLDEGGVICDCNRASEALFNYPRSELVWRHVSMLLPQLAELELMQDGQPNPRLRFLSRTGRHYRAETKNGGHFDSNLFFNRLETIGHGRLSLIVRPAAPSGEATAT